MKKLIWVTKGTKDIAECDEELKAESSKLNVEGEDKFKAEGPVELEAESSVELKAEGPIELKVEGLIELKGEGSKLEIDKD